MKEMKVLFLDFDGVLNLWPNPSRSGDFHKPSCINLEYLLNKVPDLRVVVSSSWRHFGYEAVRDILKSNGIDPRRIIGITGDEKAANGKSNRGYQIESWLKKHPEFKKYAVVDDESYDMSPVSKHLAKTDKYVGLTQAIVEKLMEILGE